MRWRRRGKGSKGGRRRGRGVRGKGRKGCRAVVLNLFSIISPLQPVYLFGFPCCVHLAKNYPFLFPPWNPKISPGGGNFPQVEKYCCRGCSIRRRRGKHWKEEEEEEE